MEILGAAGRQAREYGKDRGVHPLLDQTAPTNTEAVAAIHLMLTESIAPWRWLRRGLGKEASDDIGTALAWQLVSRQLLRVGTEELLLRRSRDELLATLRDAEAGKARNALGVAMAGIILRFGLSVDSIGTRIRALERGAHATTFASRAELRAFQSATIHLEAERLLAILGIKGEREQLLAQALATGIERAVNLGQARELLRSTGRLIFSAEELAEAGVNVQDLSTGGNSTNVDQLFSRAIAEARSQLAKGWPLCTLIGPWRGRMLSFALRWYSAELSALEFAEDKGNANPAQGKTMRLVACATFALGPRRAPY